MFAFMFYIHKLSYIMKREISSPTFQYGKVYGFRHLHLIYKLKEENFNIMTTLWYQVNNSQMA